MSNFHKLSYLKTFFFCDVTKKTVKVQDCAGKLFLAFCLNIVMHKKNAIKWMILLKKNYIYRNRFLPVKDKNNSWLNYPWLRMFLLIFFLRSRFYCTISLLQFPHERLACPENKIKTLSRCSNHKFLLFVYIN